MNGRTGVTTSHSPVAYLCPSPRWRPADRSASSRFQNGRPALPTPSPPGVRSSLPSPLPPELHPGRRRRGRWPRFPAIVRSGGRGRLAAPVAGQQSWGVCTRQRRHLSSRSSQARGSRRPARGRARTRSGRTPEEKPASERARPAEERRTGRAGPGPRRHALWRRLAEPPTRDRARLLR